MKLLPSENIQQGVIQYGKVSGMRRVSPILCDDGFDQGHVQQRARYTEKYSIASSSPLKFIDGIVQN